MLEVENKYRCALWDGVRATLVGWGAECDPVRKDSDTYFSAPDRDFAATGEAFRLRVIGPRNVLTYKGPKLGREIKTRVEHELCLGEGPRAAATAVRLLSSLGYAPLTVVTKLREVFRFRRAGFAVEACFDNVGAIGRFVELEILCEPPAREAAEAAVHAIAADLGLTDREPRSYLELVLSRPWSGESKVG